MWMLQAAAQVFAPFGDLNPFHISDWPTPAWMMQKLEGYEDHHPACLDSSVAQHADRASGAVMQHDNHRLQRPSGAGYCINLPSIVDDLIVGIAMPSQKQAMHMAALRGLA
ncbi:TPA: hypothetical protein ACH3X2_001006, partial [Trebouxia sp. C0005]